MGEPVTVQLSENGAILFRKFMEHYDLFELLIENDLPNSKNASVTINFDSKGKVGSIVKNESVYSRRHT